MYHPGPSSPVGSSRSDPDFDRKTLAGAFQMHREMLQLVSITRDTIAATRVMIAEADRILARI